MGSGGIKLSVLGKAFCTYLMHAYSGSWRKLASVGVNDNLLCRLYFSQLLRAAAVTDPACPAVNLPFGRGPHW
jgi:hypothetical protein